jgi:hypothetical protein
MYLLKVLLLNRFGESFNGTIDFNAYVEGSSCFGGEDLYLFYNDVKDIIK